jgi:thiosulfate dehydrogenase
MWNENTRQPEVEEKPLPDSLRYVIVEEAVWVAPPESLLPSGPNGEKIRYGKELIAHTAKYFGPKGKVAQITNGMNCQNCHLDAGGKPFGNNYSAVASTYPKLRARSGQMESMEKRINDCFERSLNGTAIDSSSTEMQAMVAYMNWLGQDVEKKHAPPGSGIVDLPYMARAADPVKGKAVYTAQCESCHMAKGQGQWNPATNEYTYPPLWGPFSYNDGAGLYRLSRFAGYVYTNMPFGQATHDNVVLTPEEAWDVAAFVNSQPRPKKDLSHDWPDISKKPIDHPFGPYADGFSEQQHKYGPFEPIAQKKGK